MDAEQPRPDEDVEGQMWQFDPSLAYLGGAEPAKAPDRAVTKPPRRPAPRPRAAAANRDDPGRR